MEPCGFFLVLLLDHLPLLRPNPYPERQPATPRDDTLRRARLTLAPARAWRRALPVDHRRPPVERPTPFPDDEDVHR